MSEAKASRTVTVANPDGLHIRAASLIAKLTGQVPAKVELVKGNQRVDATNVLQIVSLCALKGEQLLLEATGRGAHAALEALVELFENQFADNSSDQPGPGEDHKPTPGAPDRSDAAAEDGPPAP
jgi:phosphotransferase system HPr (HPr) family protein